MRRWLLGRSLLLLLGCALLLGEVGLAAAGVRVGAPDLVGTWQVEGSSARFRIFWTGKTIGVEGWDSSDGEKFVIDAVTWEPPLFRLVATMPSTNYTTTTELRLTTHDRLEGRRIGNAAGPVTWTRINE